MKRSTIRRVPSGGGWATLAALLALPIHAHAHGQIQGFGDFGGGFVHPLLTPAHLLVLLGVGLWVGRQYTRLFRAMVLLCASFSAIGLGLSNVALLPTAWQASLAVVALVLAALVIGEARLPAWASLPAIALSALLIGLDSVVDAALPPLKVGLTLAGTWLAVNVCVVNIAYYVSQCPNRRWLQIGFRVAGSWIAAICLLVLAFSLRAS